MKLYLPEGYGLFVPDHNGPGDVRVAVRRGDHDLDGQVDLSDEIAFKAAYSRPRASARFVEALFEVLQTFDFDGDGDIDCRDHNAFTDAWTGVGGGLAFFDLCDVDQDGDGVGDGDDDCPGTQACVTIDQRGCPMGDGNADGAVDLQDYPLLADCMVGPFHGFGWPGAETKVSCLNSFDADFDGDVDLADFGAFQDALAACQAGGPPGDLDGDGDGDLDDYEIFADCLTGPDSPFGDGCGGADLSCDGDVDIADFARFAIQFNGGLP
jgi:hypothetical protein